MACKAKEWRPAAEDAAPTHEQPALVEGRLVRYTGTAPQYTSSRRYLVLLCRITVSMRRERRVTVMTLREHKQRFPDGAPDLL
jgi:hypothetical protein